MYEILYRSASRYTQSNALCGSNDMTGTTKSCDCYFYMAKNRKNLSIRTKFRMEYPNSPSSPQLGVSYVNSPKATASVSILSDVETSQEDISPGNFYVRCKMYP